jgi:hypothetical protein
VRYRAAISLHRNVARDVGEPHRDAPTPRNEIAEIIK